MKEPPYAWKRKPRHRTALQKTIKYITIKDRIPPRLKVSPAVCITQKSRHYCVILDISFLLCANCKYISSVNDTTVKTYPQHSTGQLGSMLEHLVALMVDNYDTNLPLFFKNIYTTDGFWRLVVSHIQAWNFLYAPPTTESRPIYLGEGELVVPTNYKWGVANNPPSSVQYQKLHRMSHLIWSNKNQPSLGISLRRS